MLWKPVGKHQAHLQKGQEWREKGLVLRACRIRLKEAFPLADGMLEATKTKSAASLIDAPALNRAGLHTPQPQQQAFSRSSSTHVPPPTPSAPGTRVTAQQEAAGAVLSPLTP